MGDGRGGRWRKGEEEKRGGGERKGNEVEERERERRGVGGVGGQNQGDGRVTCFVNALKKIKASTATFQVLLYFTLLDRRDYIISYNTLPQYSYQGRSTLQACVTFPTPSCGECC